MRRVRRVGMGAGPRRRLRPRALPRWLQRPGELDAVARARCLMVLSVLSGERPVTEAILEAKVSRGSYYKLETRALNAMLAALNPLASASDTGAPELSAAAQRIGELQERIEHLEREKRRSERLLLLARKSMRSPLMMGRRGRPPRTVLPDSIPSAKLRSLISRTKAVLSVRSTPMRGGGGTPSDGSAS